MEMNIDKKELVELCEEFINVPSPVSYYEEVGALLEKKAAEFGYEVTYDRKRTAYITLEGEDNSKTVCMGAHLDTIGLVVRHIDDNGHLIVRQLGGVNYHSMEGEGVTIITRDGRKYRGMVICKAHSVHVFEDARTMPRDEDHMEVILHEDVHSKEEVMALGIDHGDVISVDPHFEYTPSGYVVSRYIDDKAAVAALIEVMAYFKRNNFSPYDRELTTRIINQAKKTNLNYCVDVFFHYGTDANAAIRAGNNVYAAAFGMAVINSHGKERCHIDSIVDTTKLAIAYALDL